LTPSANTSCEPQSHKTAASAVSAAIAILRIDTSLANKLVTATNVNAAGISKSLPGVSSGDAAATVTVYRVSPDGDL
jgi:hypothetical protein